MLLSVLKTFKYETNIFIALIYLHKLQQKMQSLWYCYYVRACLFVLKPVPQQWGMCKVCCFSVICVPVWLLTWEQNTRNVWKLHSISTRLFLHLQNSTHSKLFPHHVCHIALSHRPSRLPASLQPSMESRHKHWCKGTTEQQLLQGLWQSLWLTHIPAPILFHSVTCCVSFEWEFIMNFQKQYWLDTATECQQYTSLELSNYKRKISA